MKATGDGTKLLLGLAITTRFSLCFSYVIQGRTCYRSHCHTNKSPDHHAEVKRAKETADVAVLNIVDLRSQINSVLEPSSMSRLRKLGNNIDV